MTETRDRRKKHCCVFYGLDGNKPNHSGISCMVEVHLDPDTEEKGNSTNLCLDVMNANIRNKKNDR